MGDEFVDVVHSADDAAIEFISDVDDAWLNPALVEKLPVDWARAHHVLPIERAGQIYALAASPSAAARLDELSLLLQRDIYPILTTPEVLRRAIDRCYAKRAAPTWIDSTEPSADAELAPAVRAEDLLRTADDAPVAQYVNGLLLDAVRKRASDLHIEPFESHLLIRFRIDGFLYSQPPPPRSIEAALVSRIKVMARMDIAERRLPQDGMARVRVGDSEFDIRVSTVPVAEGERVVLRILNQQSLLRPLSGLGMPPSIEADVRRAIAEPHGIILVTGPTGSGKTTTLYAALQALDTARLNVMTIEDPIEYQIPNVAQIQVKPKIGLTFAQGLRHILRQDPDVIFVGEIRDPETAEIAIRASLTGHLVFSTLHTNDALSAVIRLADMGTPTYLLASALRGCLAQRLVRCLCPVCKQPGAPTADELRAFGPLAARFAGRTIWRAGSCPECIEGYRERVGLFEWVAFGPDWEADLRAGADIDALRRRAKNIGCLTLLDDGIEKVISGVTSIDEVVRTIGAQRIALPA
jgi:general secretion pathway protein E